MLFQEIFVLILSSQILFLSGIKGNEQTNSTDLVRIQFNETDRYSNPNETTPSNRTVDDDDDRTTEKSEDMETYDEEDEAEEDEHKFVSTASDITLEHIDFVMLRLSHIEKKTTANITELRILQQGEFDRNEIYKQGWAAAVKMFNESTREELLEKFSNDSIVAKVPDEYHIALIAYSLQVPTRALYSDFNKKTREVCSGKDIDLYNYTTYFKFLLLAIRTLGQEKRFRSGRRFLYRGVGSSKFSLQVGQILAFQHFVSTSTSLKIAEHFSENSLFEVQGKYETAISIQEHSLYAGEEEFLFSPFQVYEVESIHEGKYYTRYVLIAHTLPKTDACSISDDGTSKSELGKAKSTNDYLQGGTSGGLDYKSSMHLVLWLTISVHFMSRSRF